MANAEYKFTNEDTEVRGRVAEVIEFAKARGIFVKQVQVFKDPEALKNADTTHAITDTPSHEDEEDACGDECCCSHTPDVTPPTDEDREEMAMRLTEFFADLLGFNS